MQAQLTFGRFHVVANETSFVRWQAIEDQTHRLFPPMHQLAEQLDEQFAVQATHVGAEPKLPARTYRRSGRDRLTLPRPIHDRRLTTLMLQSILDASHKRVSALSPEGYFRVEHWSKVGESDLNLAAHDWSDLRLLEEPPNLRQPRCSTNEGDNVTPAKPARTLRDGGRRNGGLCCRSRIRCHNFPLPDTD